jgi:hypothetical protein
VALKAYRHVARSFDWRKIGSKQRDLLREILEGRAANDCK